MRVKKGLFAIVVVALAGVAVFFLVTRSPERAACARMAELCGTQGGQQEVTSCADDFAKLRKLAGDEAMDKGLACVHHAKGCPEATACMAGTGFKGLGSAVKSFFQGLGKPDKPSK